MPTAVRTLYRHEIGYLELQIGKGRLKVYLNQHCKADKEAHITTMHSSMQRRKAEKRQKDA